MITKEEDMNKHPIKEVRQALDISKKLGVKVWDNNTVKSASWSHGMQIEVNLKKQKGAYPILHELGHVFMQYGCCREHCEYTAHGFAFGLAKAYNIKIPKKVMKHINVYAGRSSHDSCGAINKKERLDIDKEKVRELLDTGKHPICSKCSLYLKKELGI